MFSEANQTGKHQNFKIPPTQHSQFKDMIEAASYLGSTQRKRIQHLPSQMNPCLYKVTTTESLHTKLNYKPEIMSNNNIVL